MPGVPGVPGAAARGERTFHPMVAAWVLRELQQHQHVPHNDLTLRELAWIIHGG